MLPEGARVGRYSIESLLGAGGMGEVYCAYDNVLRRRIALKVLHHELQDAAARLLREARAAAALSHPGAVSIFDVGESDGLSFIAMELVPGAPLRTYIGDASVSLTRRLRWLADVAEVLAVAHEKGFVHRDIKPENVMVGSDDTVKILDFGIAKQTGSEAIPPPTEAPGGPSSYRTAEGRVTGTPRYMAPEQLRGEALDGRTDQYAWGAMAYELLAGVHPRASMDTSRSPEMLNHRVPEIPFEVAAAVSRALAPTPELRFPTMGEIASIFAAQSEAMGALAWSSGKDHPVRTAASTPKGTADTVPEAERHVETATATAGTRRLVRVRDPRGTTASKVLVPAAGIVAMGLGGVSMYVGKGHRLPTLGGFLLFALGLLFTYFRPLFERRRGPRVAELVLGDHKVRIAHAGVASQSIEAVTGASIAPAGERTNVSLARSKGELAVSIDVPDASDAQAILSTFGVTESPFGTLRWSLGRGPFEWVSIALGLCWRIALPSAFLLPVGLSRRESALVAGLGIATSLLAMGARLFFPRSGPYVDLSASGVEIVGRVARGSDGRRLDSPTVLRGTDIARAFVDERGLQLKLHDTTAITVGMHWLQGVSRADLECVAAHVEAMAAVARTRTMESMLTVDELEDRHRVDDADTRRTG